MNNEAILSKLIELGYVETQIESIYLNYFDADGEESASEHFNPEKSAADFELVQRALFDECTKQNMYLTVMLNRLIIERSFSSEQVYEGDTSRESFVEAFCKVTGIGE